MGRNRSWRGPPRCLDRGTSRSTAKTVKTARILTPIEQYHNLNYCDPNNLLILWVFGFELSRWSNGLRHLTSCEALVVVPGPYPQTVHSIYLKCIKLLFILLLKHNIFTFRNGRSYRPGIFTKSGIAR